MLLLSFSYRAEEPFVFEDEDEVRHDADDSDEQVGHREVGEEEVGDGAQLPPSQDRHDHQRVPCKTIKPSLRNKVILRGHQADIHKNFRAAHEALELSYSKTDLLPIGAARKRRVLYPTTYVTKRAHRRNEPSALHLRNQFM